jgi:hypothetical protein
VREVNFRQDFWACRLVWPDFDKGFAVSKEKRWPKPNRIAWVEQRLLERLAANKGKVDHRELDSHDVPEELSLNVWLAKDRDGLSWQQIVRKYFPRYLRTQQKDAGISKARRAYGVVERALEPTPKVSIRGFLNARIEDLFGCTPEEFKKYLESIRTDKRK